MDIPAYVVFCALTISTAAVILSRVVRAFRPRQLEIMLVTIAAALVALIFLGEFVLSWAGNTTCSAYLGCVFGFLGYDAFEHLFFGVALALAIVWVGRRYPAHSIVCWGRWRNLVTILALAALASVAWEMTECVHDAFRVDILHQPLSNIRLHLNLLDQPTNIDTMGDLSFGLLGSILGFLLSSFSDLPIQVFKKSV